MFSLLGWHLRPRLRAGLTLLELLVVLVAIGILVALAAFGYGQAMERAYRAAMLNDLRNFATARSLYASEQESYPATVEAVGNHNYTESVFEIDYWNGGAFYSLVVGHRKTETVCSVTEYEGEGYWIGCERRNRLEFEANPGAGPLDIQFDAQAGIIAVGLTPSDIQRVSWSYGDGKTSAGGSEHQTPSHTYSQSGTYRVQLVVLPKQGRMRVGYRDVQLGAVDGAPPVAEFDLYEVVGDTTTTAASFQSSAPEGEETYASSASLLERFKAYAQESFTLTASLDSLYGDTVYIPVGAKIELDASPSFDPAGRKIVSYEWSFSGLSTRLDGKVVRHLWNTEPTVTLTVKNDLGLTSSRTKYVKFMDPGAPFADFTWRSEPADAGATVQFDASKSLHTGLRRIRRFHWQFQDGTTEEGMRPTKRFNASGPQVVMLAVQDDRGVTSTKTDTVTVRAVTLVADWDFCRSYGGVSVDDVVGSYNLALKQPREIYQSTANYWKAGPPAHLDFAASDDTLTSKFWLEHPAVNRETRDYTWVVLANHSGLTGNHEYLLFNQSKGGSVSASYIPFRLWRAGDATLYVSMAGGDYNFGAWPSSPGWHAIAVRVADGADGKQQTEVFVDGVSRGTKTSPYTSYRTIISGLLEVGQTNRSGYTNSRWRGQLAGMSYYEGRLTAEEVQARSAEMLRKATENCGPGEGETKASFTVSPEQPRATEAAIFDASASIGKVGAIIKWKFDYGDWSTPETSTTDPVFKHAYATPGVYNVMLEVTDEDGNTAVVRRTVEVVGAMTELSHWSACPSYGEGVLYDVKGAASAPFVTPGTSRLMDWSKYWSAGPPASVDFTGVGMEMDTIKPLAHAETSGLSRSSRSFTWLFRAAPNPTVAGQETMVWNENVGGSYTYGNAFYQIWRQSNGQITVSASGGSAYYGAWPAGWSTVAVQHRLRGTGFEVEVFVNGVSRGTKYFNTAVTHMKGRTRFFQDAYGTANPNEQWKGQLAHAAYWEGAVTREDILRQHEAWVAEGATACARVGNGEGTASFSHSPSVPHVGDAVRFDASASTSPTGSIQSYQWDWGDFTALESGSSPTATHAFAAPGLYRVKLVVTNSDNSTSTLTKSIQVLAAPTLVAHWKPCGGYGTNGIPEVVGGMNMTITPNTAVSNWRPYWPRQNPVGFNSLSSSTKPVVIGEAAGMNDTTKTFTLVLLANHFGQTNGQEWLFDNANLNGGSSSTNRNFRVWRQQGGEIAVSGSGGNAYFGPWPTGWHTIMVQMRARPNGGQEAEVFVDGVSRNTKLLQPGSYFVTVSGLTEFFVWAGDKRAHYQWGGQAGDMMYFRGALSPERMRTLHEELLRSECAFPPNQPPVASFTYLPTSPAAGAPVSFNASGSSDPDGQIRGYEWDFGDGSRGTGVTPSRTYASAGQYKVKLTVVDDAGAAAETTEIVTVGEPPTNPLVARFTYTPSNPAVNQWTSFDASTSSGASTYAWLFEKANTDGTDAILSPSSAYKTASENWSVEGTYSATLTVRNAAGDSAKATQYVTVGGSLGDPVARISYSPKDPLAGDTVTFSGTESFDPDGSIVAYAWQFPGGVTASSSVVKAVLPEGTHPVLLTVTDNSGRTGFTSVSVIVGPREQVNRAPVAVINPYPSYTETSWGPAYFDGRQSYDPDNAAGPLPARQDLQYFWSPGDGSLNSGGTELWYTGSEMSHAYKTPGTYTVRLRVVDKEGAVGESTHTIKVALSPVWTIEIRPRDQTRYWVSGGCNELYLQAYVTKDGKEYYGEDGVAFSGAIVRWGVISGPVTMGVNPEDWFYPTTKIPFRMLKAGIATVAAQLPWGQTAFATIRIKEANWQVLKGPCTPGFPEKPIYGIYCDSRRSYPAGSYCAKR